MASSSELDESCESLPVQFRKAKIGQDRERKGRGARRKRRPGAKIIRIAELGQGQGLGS